ncbi:MAG TPA: FliM/FliN family flagellar motor switch protein [Sphingobium sp.]|nr:FliM/FliN family flagellar motor switch protein [Sphingobium sp.]
MQEPKPYQFGRAAAQSPALLNAIERLGERMARSLRGILEPLSGSRPLITPKPIEQTPFMLWDSSVPQFTALSLYRLHPIKGVVTLHMEAPLISCLVDRFYGGAGGNAAAGASEFTPTENRIIDRLSGRIMDMVTACWSEIAPLEPVQVARETNVAQAEIAAADAQVVVQSFSVNIGEKDSWTIELVYPLDGLTGIEAAGSSRAIEDLRPADPVWRRKLAERMDDVRLPARTVLARPNLSMSELVALKPGDVINIHIARNLPLIIGNRVFAHGSIGEQDGRAAFLIEKLA